MTYKMLSKTTHVHVSDQTSTDFMSFYYMMSYNVTMMP